VDALILSILFILNLITVLPYLDAKKWWIRICVFFSPQTLMLSTILLIMVNIYSLSTFNLLFYINIAILFFIHFRNILPYTVLMKKEVQDDPAHHSTLTSIKILTSNVLQDNKGSDLLLKEIKKNDPDVILTLETNAEWEKKLKELESIYPYTVKNPQENLYGLHLYSKYKIKNSHLRFLVQQDVPSLKCMLEVNGKSVLFYGLHPRPPIKGEALSSKPRDTMFRIIGNEVSKLDIPVIVTGDMNDVPWSKNSKKFKRTSGLFDPRVGRGFYPSFHAKFPIIGQWPIDQCYVSKDFKFRHIEKLDHIGSDHFPMLFELSLST